MADKQLTHWKKLHNPNYIGAYALQPGEEPIYTIDRVTIEKVVGSDGKKEECCVMYFREKGVKPMILNVTNSKTLAKLYGTPFIEEWTGRHVQLYAAVVSAFGAEVEALRIRPKEPTLTKNLPELTPEHLKWDGALKSLCDGANDIEGIRKYFRLSAENEQLLLDQMEAIKCQEQDF